MRRLVHTKNLEAYEGKHKGTLIVLGAGPKALDELRRVRHARPESMVAAIGYAASMAKVDFVVSDHYEVHAELRRLQDQFGADHYTTHCAMCKMPIQYPAVDYWWRWRRSEATSLQTAVRIGLHTGFSEIILCGCPLEMAPVQPEEQRQKDGPIWPPARDVRRYGRKPGCETSAEVLAEFRRQFLLLAPEWKDKVFSMSGFTKRVLGPPPGIFPSVPKTEIETQTPDRKQVEYHWSGASGALHAYPRQQGRWPDPDAVAWLKELCPGVVCDVGCGTGRCAEAFAPENYIGVDINPKAIHQAKREWPRHRFEVVNWKDTLPKADTYLFYTVLLHIPDEELAGVLARTTNGKNHQRGRVVVFESMASILRKPTDKFTFHREPEVYIKALRRAGKTRKIELYELPSRAYPGVRHFLAAE